MVLEPPGGDVSAAANSTHGGNTGPAHRQTLSEKQGVSWSRRSHQCRRPLSPSDFSSRKVHPKYEDIPWNVKRLLIPACDGAYLAGVLWAVRDSFALVRRHGWEYVPIVVLIAFGRSYLAEVRPTDTGPPNWTVG